MPYYFISIAICFFFQNPAEVLIDRGYDQYLEENYEVAIETFNKAADIDPHNEEIYFLRGVCKSNIDEKSEAMTDYDRALKINPDYPEVYYEKAYLYLQDKNAVEAIKALDKVIELRPDMAAAYVSRGTARCMVEDVEGANADWDRAKDLGVNYSELMVCE